MPYWETGNWISICVLQDRAHYSKAAVSRSSSIFRPQTPGRYWNSGRGRLLLRRVWYAATSQQHHLPTLPNERIRNVGEGDMALGSNFLQRTAIVHFQGRVADPAGVEYWRGSSGDATLRQGWVKNSPAASVNSKISWELRVIGLGIADSEGIVLGLDPSLGTGYSTSDPSVDSLQPLVAHQRTETVLGEPFTTTKYFSANNIITIVNIHAYIHICLFTI